MKYSTNQIYNQKTNPIKMNSKRNTEGIKKNQPTQKKSNTNPKAIPKVLQINTKPKAIPKVLQSIQTPKKSNTKGVANQYQSKGNTKGVAIKAIIDLVFESLASGCF